LAPDARLIVGLVLYLLAGRAALALRRGSARDWAFADVNVAAVGGLCYATLDRYAWFLGVYLAVVLVNWALTRALALRPGRLPWVAFFFPIAVLAVVKYLGFAWAPLWSALGTPMDGRSPGLYFVGISYMAFRLSYLVLEVRNGVVSAPGLARYLGFAFFFPTMQVGPINRYSNHHRSLESPDPKITPAGRCFFRVLVGLTKYLFFGVLADQITYAGLLGDNRPRAPLDLPIAAVAYYVYVYFNFSGFCDVAIGAAGLLGIQVDENFDSPFQARNIRDYWNRWHITLSIYLRDTLFTPLSKWLVGVLGPQRRDHAISLAIFIVFVVVGVWHGAGVNFVVFGCIHAVAVVAHHYYGLWLRRRLGKEGLRRYNENRLVRAVAIAATQVYVILGLGVFAARGDGLLRLLHLKR
jgi:D-alanyl-lipoteichoic acid acyltransferase DltB (MBOAT superfamily)